MIEVQMPITTYVSVQAEESVAIAFREGQYYRYSGESFTPIDVKEAARVLVENVHLMQSPVFSVAYQYIRNLLVA